MPELALAPSHRREGPHRHRAGVEAHAGMIAGVESRERLDYTREGDRAGLRRGGGKRQNAIQELQAFLESCRGRVERVTDGRVEKGIPLVQQIPDE